MNYGESRGTYIKVLIDGRQSLLQECRQPSLICFVQTLDSSAFRTCPVVFQTWLPGAQPITYLFLCTIAIHCRWNIFFSYLNAAFRQNWQQFHVREIWIPFRYDIFELVLKILLLSERTAREFMKTRLRRCKVGGWAWLTSLVIWIMLQKERLKEHELDNEIYFGGQNSDLRRLFSFLEEG